MTSNYYDCIRADLPIEIWVHVGPSIFGDMYKAIEDWSVANIGPQYHPLARPHGTWLAGGVWREYSNYRFATNEAVTKFCSLWGSIVIAEKPQPRLGCTAEPTQSEA